MSAESSRDQAEGLFPVTDATVISRNPMILAVDLYGEVLMMSIERGTYFTLNGVASDIWRRLDARCSFAELIDQLTAEYDVSRETIAEDVRAWLNRMTAEGVVSLS